MKSPYDRTDNSGKTEARKEVDTNHGININGDVGIAKINQVVENNTEASFQGEKPQDTGQNITFTGQAGNFKVSQEQHSHIHHHTDENVICSYCKRTCKPNQTFTCKRCGKQDICLKHQDSEAEICDRCVIRDNIEQAEEREDIVAAVSWRKKLYVKEHGGKQMPPREIRYHELAGHLTIAKAAIRNRLWDKARNILEKVLDARPDDPAILDTLKEQIKDFASRALGRKRWDHARGMLAHATSFFPKADDFQAMLFAARTGPAQAAIDGHLWSQAIVILREAERDYPSHPGLMNMLLTTMLGRAREAMDASNWPNARRKLEEIIARFPGTEEAVKMLKESMVQPTREAIDNHQWDLALTTTADGIKRFPDETAFASMYKEALFGKFESHLASGQWVHARSLLAELENRFKGDAKVTELSIKVALGEARETLDAGKAGQARALLEEVCADHPENPQVHDMLLEIAQHLVDGGAWDDAITAVEETAHYFSSKRLDDLLLEAMCGKAKESCSNNEWSQAIGTLSATLQRFPNNPTAHALRKQALFGQVREALNAKSWTDAQVKLQVIAAQFPTEQAVGDMQQEAVLGQATDYMDKSEWQKARDILGAAYKKYPESPAIRKTLMTAAVNEFQDDIAGNGSQRGISFEQTISLFPDDPGTRKWILGNILDLLEAHVHGETTTLRLILARIVQVFPKDGGTQSWLLDRLHRLLRTTRETNALAMAHELHSFLNNHFPNNHGTRTLYLETGKKAARIAMDKKDWACAREALVETDRTYPNDPEVGELLRLVAFGPVQEAMDRNEWENAVSMLEQGEKAHGIPASLKSVILDFAQRASDSGETQAAYGALSLLSRHYPTDAELKQAYVRTVLQHVQDATHAGWFPEKSEDLADIIHIGRLFPDQRIASALIDISTRYARTRFTSKKPTDWKETIAQLRRIAAVYPRNAAGQNWVLNLALGYGQQCMNNGQWELSQTIFQDILTLFPEERWLGDKAMQPLAEASIENARRHIKIGKYDAALSSLRLAAEHFPGNPKVKGLLLEGIQKRTCVQIKEANPITRFFNSSKSGSDTLGASPLSSTGSHLAWISRLYRDDTSYMAKLTPLALKWVRMCLKKKEPGIALKVLNNLADAQPKDASIRKLIDRALKAKTEQ